MALRNVSKKTIGSLPCPLTKRPLETRWQFDWNYGDPRRLRGRVGSRAGAPPIGFIATCPAVNLYFQRPLWSWQIERSDDSTQSEADTRLAPVNVSPWPVPADEKSSSAPTAKACRTPARRASVAPRSAGLAPRAQRVRHHSHRACLNAAPPGRVVSCAMRAHDRAPQGSRRVQRPTATVKRRAGVRRAFAAPARQHRT
jgi:hypothetical protein